MAMVLLSEETVECSSARPACCDHSLIQGSAAFDEVGEKLRVLPNLKRQQLPI